MMIHGWLKAGPKRQSILCIEGGKDLQKGDQRVAGGKGIKVRSSRGAASGT